MILHLHYLSENKQNEHHITNYLIRHIGFISLNGETNICERDRDRD